MGEPGLHSLAGHRLRASNAYLANGSKGCAGNFCTVGVGNCGGYNQFGGNLLCGKAACRWSFNFVQSPSAWTTAALCVAPVMAMADRSRSGHREDTVVVRMTRFGITDSSNN